MSNEWGLEACGLVCARGERTLFSGLDLKIAPGDAVFVSGANGAGKTSLLRILAGLLSPVEGRVVWCGDSIARAREEFYRNLLYLGHAPALKDELTAVENLLVGARLSGRTIAEGDARQALQKMGLRGREDLPARVLSQGQRRRVNLSRLVLSDTPLLWVLDEPFAALDVRAVGQLVGIIDAHLDQGGAVVFTTHQEVRLSAGTYREVAIASPAKGVS